jgi:glyoxylase-like metal-dependent hydrolase (beta-lactamase superfamily II)
MKLYSLISDKFKLDGGACFGVVPKSVWQKLYPPDENNMIDIVNRLMIIETENRKILIDTGIGRKQEEKYLAYFHISPDFSLEKSLAAINIAPEEITDVIFTHLHFDHCGGAVKYNADRTALELTFINAIHWCSKAQWEWATKPNSREKASYHKDNFIPVFESGKLKFIEEERELYKDIYLKFANGHTDGQLIPMIRYKGRTIVYTADFIAAIGNIAIPYIPAFDTRPLISMKEKEEFLNEAVNNDYILFFEHDNLYECCTLQKIEKKISHKEILSLKDI